MLRQHDPGNRVLRPAPGTATGAVTLRTVRSLALVSRINVLTAIRDHDLQGAGPFLAALGFEGLSDEVLVERGKRYDARALLAYAHGKATGEFLGPDRITLSSLQVLTDLGFSVSFRGEVDRPKTPPAARARTTRAGSSTAAPRVSKSKPEPVVKLCPTCFTQLSMAGTCDYCE